jgi:hypothetical protein
MSKHREKSETETAGPILFSDQDMDVDEFVIDMEERTLRESGRRAAHRATRQRLEDREEARRLRSQLEDWELWDDLG